MEGPSKAPSIGDSEDDDTVLANSEFLTRQEVLERRARRLRRLAKCYRAHYWLLMEDVRRKHREFYWKYGKSPYRLEEDDVEERENGVVSVNVNNNLHINGGNLDSSSGKLGLGLGFGGSYSTCSVTKCVRKAVALTKYCMEHILLDTKQMLYKRCIYPQKRVEAGQDEKVLYGGPLPCGKAILKSITPSFCQNHATSTKRHINNALKKGGVSNTLSTKLVSKFHFHLVIKEYVHLIQSRRRASAT